MGEFRPRGIARLLLFVAGGFAVLVVVGTAIGYRAGGRAVDVFAAASLADAFTEVADEFEAETGIEVRLNFAGSSVLREQILDGAPAEVVAPANDAIMQELVEAEAVDPLRRVAARNRLVLAVPAGNPAAVTDLSDLAARDLFVGACVVEVPCGALAEEWFGAAGLQVQVDTAEPDIGFVASRLIDGELDAGLVYASTVVASNGAIETVETQPSTASAPGASYPIAAVLSHGGEAADVFIDFVQSQDGQAILERWGFDAP